MGGGSSRPKAPAPTATTPDARPVSNPMHSSNAGAHQGNSPEYAPPVPVAYPPPLPVAAPYQPQHRYSPYTENSLPKTAPPPQPIFNHPPPAVGYPSPSGAVEAENNAAFEREMAAALKASMVESGTEPPNNAAEADGWGKGGGGSGGKIAGTGGGDIGGGGVEDREEFAEDLQFVMDVLIATGMPPEKVDPTLVYAAMVATQGNPDAALDYVMRAQEHGDSHSKTPAGQEPQNGVGRMMVVGYDEALAMAIRSSENSQKFQEQTRTREQTHFRMLEDQVLNLSSEQARMDRERQAMEDIQLQIALLQSKLERTEGNLDQQMQLNKELQDALAQRNNLQASMDNSSANRSNRPSHSQLQTENQLYKEAQAAREAEVEELKSQVQRLQEAQQQEAKELKMKLEQATQQSAAELERVRAETEAQAGDLEARVAVQLEEQERVKRELAQHQQKSRELEEQRAQYQSQQANLGEQLSLSNHQAEVAEARVLQLTKECERLKDQLSEAATTTKQTQDKGSSSGDGSSSAEDIWSSEAMTPPGGVDGEEARRREAEEKREREMREMREMEMRLEQERTELMRLKANQDSLERSLAASHAEELERLKASLDSEAQSRLQLKKKAEKLQHDLKTKKTQFQAQEEKLKKEKEKAAALVQEHRTEQRQWNQQRSSLELEVHDAQAEIAKLRAELVAAKAAAINNARTADIWVETEIVSEPLMSKPMKPRHYQEYESMAENAHLPTKYDPRIPGGF